jgi:pyridinium-3,5-bisthiocarboxylic acid mononucleotide nickel chelatase
VTKVLYLDCFSGVSGDMVLGACLDAGLPLDALRAALGSLGLDDYAVSSARVLRAGVSATRWVLEERVPAGAVPAQEREEVRVADGSAAADRAGHGGRGAAHHRHPHRHVGQIERLIARSALAPASRERAIALVHRLAAIEADIHQMPIEDVHLHEVGALDSILDIVGGVFALEWFDAERIVASPLNLGSGTVRCAHGTFPVPAPATARLTQGAPVYQDGPAVELTTPTGALLVTGFATSFGPIPPMRVDRIGYGAGHRDFADRPNVLRVLVGEAETRGEASAASPSRERVSLMTFEIDDMNPQIYGVLIDMLLAAGAHDVYYTPVQMKKGRPGTLVTVLARPEQRAALSAVVFRETTTLGVRYHDEEREVLDREIVAVATPWGPVPVKVARLGGVVTNAAPEFEACLALARAHGVPIKDIQAAATKAWLDMPGTARRP